MRLPITENNNGNIANDDDHSEKITEDDNSHNENDNIEKVTMERIITPHALNRH